MMSQNTTLSEQFESNRAHLHAVAYRMLSSQSDADDAVQEAWLRLDRAGANDVANLRGWLTTIVARVALDMLRSRQSRREEPLEAEAEAIQSSDNPQRETELADSVGLALLVVLERLAPAERLAFVLHDMFGLPFSEIAGILECSDASARQLASRARRRVRGSSAIPDSDFARRREVAEAFLKASRDGDFEALLAVLAPDVRLVTPDGREVRGARTVAGSAIAGRAANGPQSVQLALVNGNFGIIVALQGRLMLVLELNIVGERITAINAIADAARLSELELGVLG